MKEWTLKDPKKMGDNDPKYGQTWWSYTHDSDMPLMFNLMEGAVEEGSRITAEEWVNKESAKGTEYQRLKKVKVLSHGGGTTPQASSTDATGTKLLELIYENTNLILEKLTDVPPPKSLKDQWDKTTSKEDTVADLDPEEPMDLSQIPF